MYLSSCVVVTFVYYCSRSNRIAQPRRHVSTVMWTTTWSLRPRPADPRHGPAGKAPPTDVSGATSPAEGWVPRHPSGGHCSPAGKTLCGNRFRVLYKSSKEVLCIAIAQLQMEKWNVKKAMQYRNVHMKCRKTFTYRHKNVRTKCTKYS